MSTPDVSLRPCGPDDIPFLYQVYASTRLDELAPLGWSAAQQHAFLSQQFEAQHQYYHTHYAGADFLVILRGEQPIGRMYVERCPDQLRLIDIALLPGQRGAGIGSHLLRELLAEAQACDKPVRIHVEKYNPALRLYQRLGFAPIEDRGVYWYMEWTPSAEPAFGPAKSIVFSA